MQNGPTTMPKSAAAPKIGVLFSGGLDSAILLDHLILQEHRVFPIYVASGLCWQPAELAAARCYLAKLAIERPQIDRLESLVVLDLPLADVYGDHWSLTGHGVPNRASADEAVYLPGRNPLLIIKARLWCQMQGIAALALGSLKNNPFADATADFFTAFERALDQAASSHVRLVRPFAEFSKLEVMRRGGDLPLEQTFSCLDPKRGLHCGNCNKCAERASAFRQLEREDPTQYARTDPARSTKD